ncbi:MAG: ATP-dependent DNA helicase, partial [Lachnospiraceae bacterium]|nr:ATP-dependent DNA helicase [Lachnospiraceae bacterium]
MNELKISVRYLVEFVLRSGDLKSGEGLSRPEAMLEGGRIHRKLQKAMGSTYRSEVPLKYEKEYDSFVLIIEGRADGIYKVRGTEVIDEIKGTYTD